MHRILLATGNQGKIAEFQALLGDDVEVLSLKDAGIGSPEETGTTFEENAKLKAVNAATRSGMLAVADDSGIEVDALGGAPGVYSARYAGPDATDERNRQLLLSRLAGVETQDRGGRFVCVVAVASADGTVRTFRGTLPGRVAGQAAGSGGFGYDSIFELDDGRTVAELSAAEKNRISHRGTALRNALPYIQSMLVSRATAKGSH